MKGRPKKNQTLTTLETLDPNDFKQDLQQGINSGTITAITVDEPTAFTAEPKETPKELKYVALSVLRNPKTQRWALVSVKYDFLTNTFGPIEIMEESIDREDVLYRFRVLSGTHFMSEVY